MAVAAYAAVVSLIHVLDLIQQYPSRHRLHLDRDRIDTLRGNVSFLQDFLELYSQIKSKEIEDLAMQISDVAIEAENVIDTHVVDQLRALSVDKSGRAFSLFCEDIDRVIEKIESIKKELMVVKEEMAGQERHPGVSVPAVSSAPPSISSGKNSMVGFDEHLVRIMEELTGYQSDLRILPIVGMGGIGKTTLARNVFDHPFIVHHFHIRIWLTISQEYSIDEILLSLLRNLGVLGCRENHKSGKDLDKLGEKLYKSLSGRRYLIVMDDLWSSKAWHDLMLFFPDNGNGSRVMVTTRLSNVAISLGCRNPYLMDFLDEDQSWNLFREKAFGQKGCPPGLEEIGKNIAKSCKGLPIAIVVIGGLLSTSNMTREYWEFVAENVNSLANTENDEHCLKILSLSYHHLPIHLKPCFLYTIFLEVNEIKVSELIKLWVAEGFLKPIIRKSLEEVATQYLKDLIGRNLILIRKWTLSGKLKTCSIHDLLRDLCIRESRKEHLFSIPRMQKTCFPKYDDKCFLCNRPSAHTRIYLSQVIVASQATSPASCFVCDVCRCRYPQINAVRLVRVIDPVHGSFSDEFPNRLISKEILHPTKLPCFYLTVQNAFEFMPTSIPLLWSLQTVIIQARAGDTIVLPSTMWDMPQLRHLLIDEAILHDPVITQVDWKDSTIVLESLQTLCTMLNFRCSTEALKRIPNLKKLRIRYLKRDNMEWSYYSLHNLVHLHKLESLGLDWKQDFLTWKTIAFPQSLKKLVLTSCKIPWEEMMMIGSLSNLEVLKLYHNAFAGPVWNPVEGEFLKLKLLFIDGSDLECWGAEKIHFPNLERLVLRHMFHLKEIPLEIGEIETLNLIDLSYCCKSVIDSAKEIQEEQHNLGIEGLQLHVRDTNKEENIAITALKRVSDLRALKARASNFIFGIGRKYQDIFPDPQLDSFFSI